MKILKKKNTISYFANVFTKSGNYFKGVKITRSLLKKFLLRDRKNPFIFLYITLLELRPVFKLGSIKVGRNVYKIPFPVKFMESYKIAFSLLADSALRRKEKGIVLKLYAEIKDLVFHRRGVSYKKLIKDYAEGLENRDFGHYRW